MNVTSIAPFYLPDIPLQNACPGQFFSQSLGRPFNDQAISFLHKLSRHLLAHSEINKYPELVALAFWLRKSNINKIYRDFQKILGENEIVSPRGVAFHVSPSNVDGIFIYSWALSLLSGNINIIRVSQNLSEQQNFLFSALQTIMQSNDHHDIKKSNIVLTYPHDAEISSFFTERSDIRILWGGDETVQLFRSLPSQPTTKDISFADKSSHCIIDSKTYNSVNLEKANEIARLFYNDAYWFSQMACSSPRTVYFVGNVDECRVSSERFWRNLAEELQRRETVDTMPNAMNKFIFLHRSVCEGLAISSHSSLNYNKPTVVRVSDAHHVNMETHCGGGFFFETFLEDLSQLGPLVQPKDQTLSYFGFDKRNLRNFASKLGKRGLHRIVPIGQSLDFSTTWDGYVLLTELTQRISIL
ncbi:MAG: hypothetical protein HQM13_14765 [SAR324 cluster bacterium]|nr:hypothetical protein [SAR324 cluster bacterium]